MLRHIPKLIPLGFALGLASLAHAGTVRLNSLDGGTSFSGELLDYDGQTYTLKTIIGQLQIDAFQVECVGDACPSMTAEVSDFGISGSSSVVGNLFADILYEFGLDIGGDTMTTLGTGGPDTIQLANELGDAVANVSLNAQGSIQGLRDLFTGSASLAVTNRPVTNDENGIFRLSNRGDLTTPEHQKIFALDGLVVVTSRSNPLRAIAEQDLARIFSGQVTNWSQIGGPDAKINIYARAEDSGTGVVFNNLVMEPARASLAENAKIEETDAAVSKAVSADPLGIGITGFADSGNAKVLDIRGTCGIQVPATPFTIKTEEYPLTRRLYTYTAGSEQPAQLVRLMDFLDTEPAQAAISNAGFVDLGVSYQSNDEQGLRYLSAVIPTDVEMTMGQLREMTANLISADRLSITYRFALGSSKLDARAEDDIQRLAGLLSTGDFNNKELLLIGFTDSIGNGGGNINLSLQRANEVRAALSAALPGGAIEGLPIRALGFGEISPLACNDTDNGRRINRRVEVWLRDTVTTSR